MAEQEFTRCPGCKTIFRVTPQQLTLRGGQVRCGHCHTVFNGVAALLSLAPRPRPERSEPVLDEAALGPPTVTLRSAHALEPAAAADDGPERRTEPSVEAALADDEAMTAATPKPRTQPVFLGRKSAFAAGCRRGSMRAAVPLLVLLLAGQALFHFRDADRRPLADDASPR